MVWRAAVAGLEAATGVCAALNLAYFLHRATYPGREAVSRRAAALVLAVLSLGALAESVFVLASISLQGEATILVSAEWALVRLPAFVGTACVSALVVRAIGSGGTGDQ
jgi:hypothetical protein